jgi:hypothetical protein
MGCLSLCRPATTWNKGVHDRDDLAFNVYLECHHEWRVDENSPLVGLS